MWRATNADGTLTYAFVESVKATYPFYAIRLLGGVLFLAGMLIMAYNTVRTIAGSKPYEAPIPTGVAGPRVGLNMKLNQEQSSKAFPGSSSSCSSSSASAGSWRSCRCSSRGRRRSRSTGLKPYSPLALTGRDIYVREGCYNCHSQMIRPFRAETERYGPYSVAGEFVYDHPFQWGSKRTGPDLARVGARYSDDWHRVHLNNPRDVVPESNMPGYPWLATTPADAATIQAKMRTLRMLGLPYTDEEIADAPAALADKTEQDALIAYLQGMGVLMRNAR